MIELRNNEGRVEGWHIRSAFEAKMIGRAAVWGDPNEATTLYFHHNGTDSMAMTEVEFLDREIKHGPLVVSSSLASRAEQGFRQVVSTGLPWNGIDPSVACAFLNVIDDGRQIDAATQVPDFSGPITVTRQTKQAA